MRTSYTALINAPLQRGEGGRAPLVNRFNDRPQIASAMPAPSIFPAPPKPPVSRFKFRGSRRWEAFTLIEIAISLAVIGFALVAIIGILPSGMNVQRDNRQETVIVQDASVIIDGIRNGSRGLDDLTNFVESITVYAADYNNAGRPQTNVFNYNPTNSTKNGSLMSPMLPLTSGSNIIGLLSTPKYITYQVGPVTWVRSNYVVAQIRSLSGPASEKLPQTNSAVEELAFTYRVFADLVPHADYDRTWTNYTDPTIAGLTNEIIGRSNYWLTVASLQTNLYDLRLRFRWPVLPNRGVGNGQQTFRTQIGGHLAGPFIPANLPANPPAQPPDSLAYGLYFFEPRNYVRSQ